MDASLHFKILARPGVTAPRCEACLIRLASTLSVSCHSFVVLLWCSFGLTTAAATSTDMLAIYESLQQCRIKLTILELLHKGLLHYKRPAAG